MKKVLALMGSPRREKNTEVLMDYLLSGIEEDDYEINRIYLKDKNILPCTGCDYCGRIEACVSKDDMEEIYDGFDNSHIIILAAPIYFNSVNGLTKNMIDRCQRYYSLKYSIGKKYKDTDTRQGFFLATGGAPFTIDQFSGAVPVVDYFFKAINAKYKGNYFISHTDKEPVSERIDVKDELFNIGLNIWNTKDFYIQK